MDNPICKKCGTVIYSNEMIDMDSLSCCKENMCVNADNTVETSDPMSWTDLRLKHDRYE